MKSLITTYASVFLFCLGLYILCKYPDLNYIEITNNGKHIEPFQSLFSHNSCENILIKKDNLYYLRNTNRPEIPGINPKIFNHLDEYTDYIEYQRSQGIRCPVLFLQNIENTQGEKSYRVFSDPEQSKYLQGLPFITESNEKEQDQIFISADLENNPGSYPGSDKSRMSNGYETILDKKIKLSDSKSPNAMDTNWGGIDFTNDRIDAGDFDDDKILT